MSDPIVAPKKPGDPAVVDIRDGDWKFGYQGLLLKQALFNKVGLMENDIKDLLNQIEREIGDNTKSITTLMVALHTEGMSTKALYVKSMCEKVVNLQNERGRLARAAKGFNDKMVYVISIEDMEAFGL